MGSFVLIREQSVDAQGWDDRLREPAEQRHPTPRHARAATLPPLRPSVALLGNAGARRWLVEVATNIAVLGGFVAAPVLTLAAWLGLGMPDGVFLHRLSTTLFVVSLIWICAAVVVAHMHESGTASSRD